MPLPLFIENLYQKQFGKKVPDDVGSVEEKVAEKRARKEASKVPRRVNDLKIPLTPFSKGGTLR